MDGRNLTDADVEALAEALEKRIVGKFYLNFGKGLWALVWKGLITLMLIVAVYGAWGKFR